MPRVVLVLLVLALVALVVVDKAGDLLRSAPAHAATGQAGTRLAAAPLTGGSPGGDSRGRGVAGLPS